MQKRSSFAANGIFARRCENIRAAYPDQLSNASKSSCYRWCNTDPRLLASIGVFMRSMLVLLVMQAEPFVSTSASTTQ